MMQGRSPGNASGIATTNGSLDPRATPTPRPRPRAVTTALRPWVGVIHLRQGCVFSVSLSRTLK